MKTKNLAAAPLIGLLAALLFFPSLFAYAAPTICFVGSGCTGTSTAPAWGQILIGGKNGEYEFVASSTLGAAAPVQSVFGRTGAVTAQTGDYTTSQVTEGSNLYYTLNRWASAFAGTTTDGLAEGVKNLYFTNARAVAALTGQSNTLFTNGAGYLTSLSGAASSTILGDNNTFSGADIFTNGSANFSGTWQTFSPSHFQAALTLPLPIANGGTATTTQVTGGVNYFDGTELTSNTNFSWNNSTNQLTLGSGNVAATAAFGGGRATIGYTGGNASVQGSGTKGISLEVNNSSTPAVFINSTGNVSIQPNADAASSTPWASFNILQPSNAVQPAFVVASTTGSATTTVFEIDQNGLITAAAAITANSFQSVGGFFNGTGSSVNFQQGGSTYMQFNSSGPKVTIGTLSTGVNDVLINPTDTASAANQYSLALTPTINQSSSASYSVLQIRPTETTLGSGTNYLIQAGTSTNANLFDVENNGMVLIGTSSPSFSVGSSFNTTNGVCHMEKAAGAANSYIYYYYTAAATQIISTSPCTGAGTTTIVED